MGMERVAFSVAETTELVETRMTSGWKATTSSAMARYVVSFPPAIVSMPAGPSRSIVSRLVLAVAARVSGSTRRPANVERIEHVALTVTNVDRAKRFYQSLGWRLDNDVTIGEG